MNIIGICGRAGAGKDTAADVLVKSFGFVKVALADPMKRICREVFAFTDEQLFGPSHFRNEPDKRYPNSYSSADEGRLPQGWLTPRHALQQLGTEWGRRCYENVWVDYALRVATKLLGGDVGVPQKYDVRKGLVYAGNYDPPDGVVIPDVRFPNEVEAIRAAGGRIWKIERPMEGGSQENWRQHVSEQHVDGIAPDVTIANDSDVERLRFAIEWVMEHLNDTFLAASHLK